ncbi:hypothetical protein FPK15_contig00113-0002 [Flavobacterium psychrophilum]|nr:hypothetical protein FPK15_contig00113-0002 [Flavobacterium psychrophilum]
MQRIAKCCANTTTELKAENRNRQQVLPPTHATSNLGFGLEFKVGFASERFGKSEDKA